MKRVAYILLCIVLAGCSGLLPRGDAVVEGPWQNFDDAQKTFDQIVPYKTTVADLKTLKLDPHHYPNITILSYSDVLRRFVPSPSINPDDLDAGVRECIAAKTVCQGLEVNHQSLKRKRVGSFWLDFLNFKRHTDITGWRFNGVLLIKGDVVVYKLVGGQPIVREQEETRNPLGPLQSIGEGEVRRRF